MTTDRILFISGKDTPVKRYQSYFPFPLDTEMKNPTIILCHSNGIIKALTYPGEPLIIAMDPSIFPIKNPRVYIWARKGRVIPQPPSEIYNLVIYDQQTHYPYQSKNLRDDMLHVLNSFESRQKN